MSDQSRAREFRRVLGGFASGVTVVTAVVDGVPVGLTCQSFFSLSLDPPLIAFSPSRTSQSYPLIRRAGAFCVNILEAGQEQLCRQFARSGTDKWQGVGWRPGVTGSPVLDGVLASIDCELERDLETGDHYLTIGRVVDLESTPGRQPLLFFNGAFERLQAA
ncbi:flavin reductase family protein [Actinoplanes derwentensis]|uniref:NADH-FMN oxidoreductase RutF, flavin reductase (DIM6/NTAB) family n=1 Tax=Actinoplanes derwentensis TaxID=113562 RepID=A0A1H2DE55_9ACTN|nr:flavin reductase family protein [Actinoplanes derwentensis]GID84810.1 monooxygenase [Actinoplanes derwentensis]SDT81038.1 NADH-FMN oxidoreductase RutF, flavin reductase (DIM6/NTAB) family [Actinoplanes derwentensis]